MIRRFAPAIPVLALVAVVACSDRTSYVVGVDLTPPPALVDPDAGDASFSPDSAVSGRMCPSNECPQGLVTCPNDPFPCSVDLSSDDDNCGACGVQCPHDEAFVQRFGGGMRCVAGTCQLVCSPYHGDCNGNVDDGCEVQIAGPGAADLQNCGACGEVCDTICMEGVCGCPFGEYCPDGTCRDLYRDNDNCGACGNVCPPSNEPEIPPELNMPRTCTGGVCNVVACAIGQADCNGDALLVNGMPIPGSDGCETSTLFDPENCGGCGVKCGAGESCFLGQCQCRCGAACFSSINSDINNCGACGLRCPGDRRSISGIFSIEIDPAHGRPTCEQGVCGYACSPNFANCDGNTENGCETPLLEDPLNCGACGVRCDAIDGQACVEGKCLMKPCGVVQ